MYFSHNPQELYDRKKLFYGQMAEKLLKIVENHC